MGAELLAYAVLAFAFTFLILLWLGLGCAIFTFIERKTNLYGALAFAFLYAAISAHILL